MNYEILSHATKAGLQNLVNARIIEIGSQKIFSIGGIAFDGTEYIQTIVSVN